MVQHEHKKEISSYNEQVECLHKLTMVSHQLNIKDTPTDFDEDIVSISCHKHLEIGADDQDTFCTPSMFVHQMHPSEVKINEALTDISDILAYEKYVVGMILSKDMESVSSSMTSHKLTSLDIPTYQNELMPSMTTHSCVTVDLEEKDTVCLPSMCSHQINVCNKSDDEEPIDYMLDYKHILMMGSDEMMKEEPNQYLSTTAAQQHT